MSRTKSQLSLFLVTIIGLTSTVAQADIWNGPSIVFTKADSVDWTLPGNQDQITPGVSITRANSAGLFNIATEAFYSNSVSPADTEWSDGTTASLPVAFTDFETWNGGMGSGPGSKIGVDAVVHLISEDIFIDFKLLTWTSGGGGGGFSYQRSTNPVPEPISTLPIAGLLGTWLFRRKKR